LAREAWLTKIKTPIPTSMPLMAPVLYDAIGATADSRGNGAKPLPKPQLLSNNLKQTSKND
jgi:hypothetical protein